MSENYVLSQEWVFYKRVVIIYILENMVVSMYKAELIIAFAARLVVEVKSIFSHYNVVVS